jgi:hypothetical protein
MQLIQLATNKFQMSFPPLILQELMETASVSSCREMNPAFPCFKILVVATMTNFNGLELCDMQYVHVEVF